MLVNICMITYNHENYIAEAIESVLRQVTTFTTRLIIAEDCSTDRTGVICMEYAAKYPEKITMLDNASNIGMMQNFVRCYRACEGKYIAFCEGDDYWTDPYKLQKQVDFLEANPDHSGCFHNVILKQQRDGENSEWPLHESLSKDSFDTVDVLGPWFIPSPSFVFVNYPGFILPDWFYNCTYGDLPFMLLLSLKGNFKYLNEIMAVYRLHDKGMTTVHKAYDKVMLMVYIYASFDIHTKYTFHQAVRNAVIYEMDRHIPLRITAKTNGLETPLKKWKRYYQRLKERVYKTVTARN
jgi:glycosyltransferase involved in cell wall biosynthesis